MTSPDNPEGVRQRARKPSGAPYRNIRPPNSVSTLGVGMVIGAVIGAGIALLVAPRSGEDTRRGITRRMDSLRGGRTVWRKLGRELRRAALTKQKSMAIEAKRREIRLRDSVPG